MSDDVVAKVAEDIKPSKLGTAREKVSSVAQSAKGAVVDTASKVGTFYASEQAQSIKALGLDASNAITKGTRKLDKALVKDVGSYAAAGAVIALPIPLVGSMLGAAIGGGIGLVRNLRRPTTATGAPTEMGDALDQLEKLRKLKAGGALSEQDYDDLKAKIIGRV